MIYFVKLVSNAGFQTSSLNVCLGTVVLKVTRVNSPKRPQKGTHALDYRKIQDMEKPMYTL